VPSFDRALGLPSAWSIPTRALRRECDPMNVHGAVRPATASSSRAPGERVHLAMRVRSGMVTLDRAPAYPLARDLTLRGTMRAPGALAFTSASEAVKRASLGFAAAYRFLQRMIDARARPRAVNPPPREAPASIRVGTACAARSVFAPPLAGNWIGTRHLVPPLRMSPPDASCALWSERARPSQHLRGGSAVR
jgi:hypothetical protein